MFNTGIFAADCREWNQRASDNKTLPHLKVFFAAAHREWRLLLQNETGTPYGAAHNSTAYLDGRYLQQETVDAIANLETSTASDRAAIAQLTATVERLTAELVTMNAKLVATLQPQRASRGGCVAVEDEAADVEPAPAPPHQPLCHQLAPFQPPGPTTKT